MKEIKRVLFLALTWAFSTAQAGDDNALVNQFFPQALIEESNAEHEEGGPEASFWSAHVNADLDGKGQADYIIAAYTNGFGAAVRVLKRTGPSAVLVAAPSFPLMGGIIPSIKMLDVNNDGVKEAIVSFSSARGRDINWVLQWDGATLQSIGPAYIEDDGNLSSVVFEGLFVDLTGDGVLEIISASTSDTGEYNNFPVYTLSEGRYQERGAVEGLHTFARATGVPKPEQYTFSASNPGTRYMMTIVNGSKTDSLVTSAEIKLNDVVVAGPKDFNRKVTVLKIPVKVADSNTLSVTLFGAPGGVLTIGVGPEE